MGDLTADLLGSADSDSSIGGVVVGGTAGSVLYVGAGGVLTQDNTNFKWGTTAGQGLTLGAGTATTDVQALSVTQTWNNAAVTFTGAFRLNIVDTASGAASRLFEVRLGGTPKIFAEKDGKLFFAGGQSQGNFDSQGAVRAFSGDAVPAGGTAGIGLTMLSATNLGIFAGSGAPTLSAAQGSLYLRTNGSGIADRLYVNTNGSTGWTNFVSAA